MSILISEIGNNHCGDFEKAKEMIKVSRDCGADLVKMQAFKAEDISGSMPQGFYKRCEFTYQQYTDLIQYGEDIGIDVFYSIFSSELISLKSRQRWQKWAANQLQQKYSDIKKTDYFNVFLSIREHGLKPELKHTKIMHVSDYLTEAPKLDNITFLSEFYNRPVGYSDHTVGVEACIEAIKEYGALFIEKHFTTTRDIYYNGKQYRDAIHSALPWELEKLAKEMKGVH